MRVIYPCEESKTLMGDKVRRDYCRHNAGELIAGGTDAKLDEFPHMDPPEPVDSAGLSGRVRRDRDRAVATGWGRTTHGGDLADTLQKNHISDGN
ncbi:hypothetical protein MSG28_014433 [Choristoneura fumiferana]|uniref:Uncharacterized protein n=1 Tax=Choristoneura fumiferana TaxID=7141 RepID=A0ACC0JRN7_CHOFU|nr:hypothetical protein MSG28_014433 [Choristoneura fumiferana]